MGVDAEYRLLVNGLPVNGDRVKAVSAEAEERAAVGRAIVVGGGPAGLIAAEQLSRLGATVTLVERMPTVGRKFLLAGRGGLNLTHSEPLQAFVGRYGQDAEAVVAAVDRFRPAELVAWAEALGQPTFVGSSGRVFPTAMKASPLLRAWLKRLRNAGVTIVTGERWTGWAADGTAQFVVERGGERARVVSRPADALVLALGGASWPRLGADGAWCQILRGRGVEVRPWRAANAGVLIEWSRFMLEAHEGAPLKRIAISAGRETATGEAIVTRSGLEGGAIYMLGRRLRALIEAGAGAIEVDLMPDASHDDLVAALQRPHAKQTLSNRLRKAGLTPVKIALLRDGLGAQLPTEPLTLAAAIKRVPLGVAGMAGLERAISSAGGIALEEIDERFMLLKMPGVFVAGEMLDWEAPTGGYLLQACFATGKAAAEGAAAWLRRTT